MRLYTHTHTLQLAFPEHEGEQTLTGKHTNDFALQHTGINNDFAQLIKQPSFGFRTGKKQTFSPRRFHSMETV